MPNGNRSRCESVSSAGEDSPRRTAFGFSSRFTAHFWKSKSKSSVGSESQCSTTSGFSSPPFTPDSTHSIYTNSLDSDCSVSSSANSNQTSPTEFSAFKCNKKLSSIETDDESTFNCSNDFEKYAANMCYDFDGVAPSFDCHVPVSPAHSNGFAAVPPFEDGMHSYYNNSTFSTFPNPRRHSISYSSYSSSKSSRSNHSRTKEEIELLPITAPTGQDGYLIPVSHNSDSFDIVAHKYQSSRKNDYVNDSVVQVDVHVPDHPDISENLYEHKNGMCSSGGYLPGSNDSDSAATIVPAKGNVNDTTRKMLPINISRVFLNASADCEPFCSLCVTTASSPIKDTNMDVAIISCQECFFSRVIGEKVQGFFDRMVTPDNHRINIALQNYDVKDLDHQDVAAEVHRAKVQIVIISNHFLERLRHEASSRKKLSPVNRVLRSKRVIAIITGTTAAEIAEGYQAVLARFHEWFTIELRSASKVDAEFCKKFTEQVLKIYNLELSNNSNFSVFPKKITREQSKIVLMLKKPVLEDDVLRVELTRGRQVAAVLDVTPSNPYTAIIRVSEKLCLDKTCLIEITLYVNEQKLGTKLVKYEYQAKMNEEDIIEKMTKAVPGFQKLLDEHISRTLMRNFETSTDWSLDPELELMNDVLISKADELPTAMHFAAYYGLEQTVYTLLGEADGLEQCAVSNESNETPIDIAQGNSFVKELREMTVSAKVIEYMKGLVVQHSDTFPLSDTDSPTNEEEEEETYCSNATASGELYLPQMKPDGEATNDHCAGDVEKSCSLEGLVAKPRANVTGSIQSDSKVVNENVPAADSLYVNIIPESSLINNKNEVKPVVRPRPRRNDSRRHSVVNYANIPDFPGNPVGLSGNHYTELSEVSPESLTESNGYVDTHYCFPKMDAYQIPPPGVRPVTLDKKDSSSFDDDAEAQPGTPGTGRISGYMVMEGTGNDMTTEDEMRDIADMIGSIMNSSRDAGHPGLTNRNGAPRSPLLVTLDHTEEELCELMNDYKNDLYTMRQLELLFQNWKRRPDVKLSYADRQARLKKMRDEYNRIQVEMKRNNRRPSVMEKCLQMLKGRRRKVPTRGSSNESITEENSLPASSSSLTTLSPQQNERKISSTSDPGSTGSGHSGTTAVSEGIEIGTNFQSNQQITWVNPLTRKCAVSYVEPTMPSSPLPRVSPISPVSPPNLTVNDPKSSEDTFYYKEPPPPRPVKKNSMSNATSVAPSGFVNPTRTLYNDDNDLVTVPPPPPPRSNNSSPFRIIQYDKKDRLPVVASNGYNSSGVAPALLKLTVKSMLKNQIRLSRQIANGKSDYMEAFSSKQKRLRGIHSENEMNECSHLVVA